MKVRFKNPPINELVIGAYFDPPLTALRNEHIGLLWSQMREEFPTVEQRPPIGGVAEGQEAIITIGGELMVMPRFWFVSEDEINLIQVQKGAFLFNWRKRKTEYPHFSEHLKPYFDRYFTMFDEFIGEEVNPRASRLEENRGFQHFVDDCLRKSLRFCRLQRRIRS